MTDTECHTFRKRITTASELASTSSVTSDTLVQERSRLRLLANSVSIPCRSWRMSGCDGESSDGAAAQAGANLAVHLFGGHPRPVVSVSIERVGTAPAKASLKGVKTPSLFEGRLRLWTDKLSRSRFSQRRPDRFMENTCGRQLRSTFGNGSFRSNSPGS